MRRVLGVLRGVVIALLAALVAVNALLLTSRFVWKQDPPHVFGYYPMVVTSGSMEPALPTGAMVIARAQAEYRIGDIISFRRDGAVVTHRVVEETAEGYTTAGDANTAADSLPVPHEAVLGKVILCLPWAGRALLFLREPIGILALAAGGAALLFLPVKPRKERYEDTENKT